MKTAIVLFNLGGPDNASAVRPFLFNLFNDPAIIRLPWFIRSPLAYLISKRRAKKAIPIYNLIGGGSPLLPNTQKQADALQALLPNSKIFICMRYWHPMANEVAEQVKDYNPDTVLMLPLYPQYSTTTTASSVKTFKKALKNWGVTAPAKLACCYSTDDAFIKAQADLIKPVLEEARKHGTPRILFTAHGLPEKIVAAGDPYQWQCEQTNAKLAQLLTGPHPALPAGEGLTEPPSRIPSPAERVRERAHAAFDWVSCYQSRVGPLKWIGPSTESEIERAGSTKTPLVIVPMSFVSEHVETLVELDIEYRELAEHNGVSFYGRVPTVSTHPVFIEGLAAAVKRALVDTSPIACSTGGRLCPAEFTGCLHAPPRHPGESRDPE